LKQNYILGKLVIICAGNQNDKAVFSIEDGKFPINKTRLVQAWIEIRCEELNAIWRLAVNGEEVFKVDPLK
jgi:hypothetical protein